MITLNEHTYTADEVRALNLISLPAWEQEIFSFLKVWINEHDYVDVQTSGSTGAAKTIRLSKNTLKSSAILSGKFFEWQGGERALLALPARYIAGKMMLVRAMVWNWQLESIEPASVIEPTKNYHFVALTPMQAHASINVLKRFGQILLGGAPVSQSLKTSLQHCKSNIWESYGMTETATHVALRRVNGNEASDVFTALNSILFSTGTQGNLIITAPHLPAPVHTTDCVELLSPTEFRWLGRLDNVINSGGLKIHPEKLEAQLKPYFSGDFFIAGMPDETFGTKVVLVIEGEQPIPDFGFLPPPQRPKEVLRLNQFERTETGKVQRNLTLSNG